MLELIIPSMEEYNAKTNEFILIPEQHLRLEHSLMSLSAWESAWKIPFLTNQPKTNEQTLDYIRCMTVNRNVDSRIYSVLPSWAIQQIGDYISATMTATTFKKDPTQRPNREIITAEIIYYWMINLNIPFECEKWHLDKLLTLIKVCNLKNQPTKNVPRRDVLARNRALNEARRKKFHTSG